MLVFLSLARRSKHTPNMTRHPNLIITSPSTSARHLTPPTQTDLRPPKKRCGSRKSSTPPTPSPPKLTAVGTSLRSGMAFSPHGRLSRPMSIDKNYHHFLNSRRWAQVKRIVWQRSGGLCEACKAHGIVTPGADCHHIVPVETATNVREMERLAYDPANCQLLCVPCHCAKHRQMGKGTRRLTAERAKQRQERWADNLMHRFTTSKSDGEPTS